MNIYVRSILLAGLLSHGFSPEIFAQGTAFTYQGRLNVNGASANGVYDLRFSVWSAVSGPSQVGTTQTNLAVAVSNGLFTVVLDFGAGVFTGPARWLEIGVRSNGISSFNTLTPRQAITPAPYAMFAANAAGGGTGPWQLNGANTYYNAGAVGVGTSNPTTRLTVSGAGAFNAPLAAAVTLENTTAAQRWELHALDDGRLQVADITAGVTRMLFGLNGNVGIGTDSPARKLSVFSGQYGIEHTDGNVRLGTYVSLAGGYFGTISNHKLNFFVNDGGASITLDTAGNVGMGTTVPTSKLDVRGALTLEGEGDAEIFTGTGGVDLNRYLLLLNSAGLQSASGLKAGGVLVADSYGYANPGKNDLVVKGTVSAGGDAIQARDKGGWVKAMAKVNADASIARQYSALGGTITARHPPFSAGYIVTFPFQVNDRFISVTPFFNGSVGQVIATVVVEACLACGPNEAFVRISDADAPNTDVANEFFILVY
jgi:hypothetical protein